MVGEKVLKLNKREENVCCPDRPTWAHVQKLNNVIQQAIND